VSNMTIADVLCSKGTMETMLKFVDRGDILRL